MNKINLYFFFFLFLCFFSCNQKVQKERIITVTIEPQRYFANQLTDSLFQIVTMVPAGTSPETYDPTPVQMAKLAESTAYFQIGKIGFEQVWIEKIKANNPNLPIYDNGKGITYLSSEKKHEGHNHAEGVDPHTWSSPKQALIIAENMCKAFIELDKKNEVTYSSNLTSLKDEINRIDSIVSDLLSCTTNKAFLIYHPALTYLANDYGLSQYCIETDGKEPSPEQMKRLVEISKEKGIKTIFIQQEFDKKNAEIIAKEAGCKLFVINPLSYNWSEEIIKIAKVLSDE